MRTSYMYMKYLQTESELQGEKLGWSINSWLCQWKFYHKYNLLSLSPIHFQLQARVRQSVNNYIGITFVMQ